MVNEDNQGLGQNIDPYDNGGDVKYHLGTVHRRQLHDGREVELTVLSNPSHLEAIDPTALGKARAIQDKLKDTQRSNVVPILIHGDAAFAG